MTAIKYGAKQPVAIAAPTAEPAVTQSSTSTAMVEHAAQKMNNETAKERPGKPSPKSTPKIEPHTGISDQPKAKEGDQRIVGSDKQTPRCSQSMSTVAVPAAEASAPKKTSPKRDRSDHRTNSLNSRDHASSSRSPIGRDGCRESPDRLVLSGSHLRDYRHFLATKWH